MAYTTPAAVRDVLTPSGSDVPGSDTAASLSDDELNAAIADAQAEVDAALSSAPTFYTVPFPSQPGTPPLVAQITRDIAAYVATVTWRKGSNLPTTHPVYLRWQRATGILDQLSTGKFVLPGFGESPATAAAVVNVTPEEWTWYPDIGFGSSPRLPG